MVDYDNYAQKNGRHERDHASLKIKFDKLEKVIMPTGSASRPSDVCRAKRIARAIKQKLAAVAFGTDSSDSEEDDVMVRETGNQPS